MTALYRYRWFKHVFKNGFDKDDIEKYGIEKHGIENYGIEKYGIEMDGFENYGIEHYGNEYRGRNRMRDEWTPAAAASWWMCWRVKANVSLFTGCKSHSSLDGV